MDKMLQTLEFHAMGCEMFAAVDREPKSGALSQVPGWFEEWEQVLSRFRYDSELTKLNQSHGAPVNVSKTLWEVFRAAQQAEQMTNGLVTPTLLDAIIKAGYDRPFDLLLRTAPNEAVSVLTDSWEPASILIDPVAQTIMLPPAMGLDFGGIAKGWSAHQAMKRLEVEGPALVNAGGDIAISGPRADGGAWLIGVTDPFHPEEEVEALELSGCGVATSGKDRRHWTRAGLPQHHIIDPLTGEPAESDLLRVTVVAPDVIQAEAAAKAAFILGSRVGLEWIEDRPQFAALFILDNGELLYSRRMDELLYPPKR